MLGEPLSKGLIKPWAAARPQERTMTSDKGAKINVDGKDYALDSLSDNAKAQLMSIQAVDRRIENLQEELAILQTARIAYGNALKTELGE